MTVSHEVGLDLATSVHVQTETSSLCSSATWVDVPRTLLSPV